MNIMRLTRLLPYPLTSTKLRLSPILVIIAVLMSQPLLGPVLAGPPAPLSLPLTQPDGKTTFEARVWGNEHADGLETLAGFTILQESASGTWFYAVIDARTGQLTTTDKIVGQDSPPSEAFKARPTVLETQAQFQTSGPVNAASIPVLVLLTSFTDQGPVGTTEADWQEKIFGAANSVKNYYEEISYNRFTIVPAAETCGTPNNGITAWLNVPKNHPNSSTSQTTYDALEQADSCVDYAAYDTNNDNVITANELAVIVIVAGYENSYGGSVALTPNVWGHQWGVYGLFDGIYYFQYGQFGEWHAHQYDKPGAAATIGIITHELGHLLGWPDLYDVDGDAEGVGSWSVMGSGSWLGTARAGDSPAHPSAWEKWYQGWLTPLKLEGTNTDYNLPQVEDSKDNSVIQLLDNPGGVDWGFGEHSGSGEYFLIENRQKVGYDAALKGCGLLIWHIDETRTSSNNANADENRKLIDLEEADGENDLDNEINRGDTGDPFPGAANNTIFNSISIPNSLLYDGNDSGTAVIDISPECAEVMTATFIAPKTPDTVAPIIAPTALNEPTNGTILIDPRPIFDWDDATDDKSEIITYTLSITGSGQTLSAQSATTQITTIQSIYTPTVDLPSGSYTWTVQAQDASGNTSNTVSLGGNFEIVIGTKNFLPLIFKGPF